MQQPGGSMSPSLRTHERRSIRPWPSPSRPITVAASGCTVANSGHGGYDPNTLRIVLSQEPPTLEPCESSLTSTGIVVRSNITEPLIERDPNTGDLQPLLATEWRQTSPNAVDVRRPRRRHLLQRRTVHRRGRGLLDRPRRQLRPAVQRRRLRVRRREARARRPPTTTPSSSAPRSRIRFCRCGSRSSRSCRRTTSMTEKVREPIGTGPYADRGLGVRPEADPRSATTPTGAPSRRSPAPNTSGAARAASAPR